jgi:hypothetical protein
MGLRLADGPGRAVMMRAGPILRLGDLSQWNQHTRLTGMYRNQLYLTTLIIIIIILIMPVTARVVLA